MNLPRIIALWLSTAWRAAPKLTVAMCACMILASTLPAVGLVGVSQVIAAFTSGQPIWPGIALTAGALLVIAVVSEVTWPVSDTVEDLVSRQVHDDLLRLTAEIPSIAHHEDPKLADRIGMIEDDVNALVGGPLLLGMLGSIASTVTVIGLLASVRPELCLLLVVALLPAAVEARSARQRNQVQLDNERYRRLAQRCVETLSAPRQGLEVRCFGLAEPLLEVSENAMRQRSQPRIAVTRRFTGYGVASWLVFGAAYATAVWWTVFRLRGGEASVGDLSLLLLIGAQVVSAGQAITSNTRMVVDQLQVFGRYDWLREYSAQRRWRESTRTPPSALSDGIRLRGVSFAYPASVSDDAREEGAGGDHPDRMAVRDIDLHLPAGSTVAFVGANGAGKSTLVNLLARLYDPTSGTVEVDGTPLTEIDPVAWRERISAGFQDYATFEFAAADSIGVGDLEHRADRTRLATAVTAGQAQAVIDGLPAGLGTQLGTRFEGGVELSGGQWQRLALARAFMRDRPLLMLLDEPTAALDPQAEQSLYEQYATTARTLAASTRTITVLVSHRFSTVRMADLIVVVQDGRISELGSHDELMRANRHYARLFDLQASAYR